MPALQRSRATASRDNFVRVRGAREHNLKDVPLEMPRGVLVDLYGGWARRSLGSSSLPQDGSASGGQAGDGDVRNVRSLSLKCLMWVSETRGMVDKGSSGYA